MTRITEKGYLQWGIYDTGHREGYLQWGIYDTDHREGVFTMGYL